MFSGTAKPFNRLSVVFRNAAAVIISDTKRGISGCDICLRGTPRIVDG